MRKSEIEVADFDRLSSKLENLRIRFPAMRKILMTVKESGSDDLEEARSEVKVKVNSTVNDDEDDEKGLK